MTKQDLLDSLVRYFPIYFSSLAQFLQSEVGSIVIERLLRMESNQLTCTHVNQLLHMTHEVGMTDEFFNYYFLESPSNHPYAWKNLLTEPFEVNGGGVRSLRQVRWGLERFFTDALLYFGSVRDAYEKLGKKSTKELFELFAKRRFDSEGMTARGMALPFHAIPVDDRYLIAELACKAYSPLEKGTELLIEFVLLKAYQERGAGKIKVKDLFDGESALAKSDPQTQMMLQFTTEEFAEETVSSQEEIREKVQAVAKRFVEARRLAVLNTRLYLSIVNELDVYVATSMRRRSDFREMNRDTARIFSHPPLRQLHVRYFDPTISAADGHEDKGLIECLMVKCAKALIYFAGESDSFGKDAEVSMALSLGKPVIILCPATEKGEQRMKFFRDIHPLSRMIQMETGIPVGAMITNDPTIAARLLERIFTNSMEYDLVQRSDGYLRLKERLTQSVVRLQTNDQMLRQSFSHYYRRDF
jgi:hypothetical protein